MLISGKDIADNIQRAIKAEVAQLPGRKPCLAVIMVGLHPASAIYVSRKISSCLDVGISSLKHDLPDSIQEHALFQIIEKLNQDPLVDGILVQLPLPPHISVAKVTEWISPEKDVDGFHPLNLGKLLMGSEDGFVPCTPLGVKKLLLSTGIPIPGKNVVIVGRSNIVGKPLAALLMQNGVDANATVTVAHSHTKNLPSLCAQADILIAAIGRPHFITAEMVKEGAIVIDVGINKMGDPQAKNGSRLVGDVDFHAVKNKCAFITPVPGGVGPMTIAMLLSNTLLSYKKYRSHLF